MEKKKAQDPSPQKERSYKKKGRDEKKRRDEAQKDFDKRMEEQFKELEDVSTYEDAQASTNPFCRRLIELKSSAERLDLVELAMYLGEAVGSLAHDDMAHLKAQQMHLECITLLRRKKGGRQMTKEELRKEWTKYIDHTSKVLQAFTNKTYANKLAEYSRQNNAVFKTVAPRGKFDMAHMQQSISLKMMAGVERRNRTCARQIEIEFEAENPVDTFLRAEEPGFTYAKEQLLDTIPDAEQANEIAREAYAHKKFWLAELLWKKAIELNGKEVKYYSNISLVRVRLGRYLRSHMIGYRGLATEFLQTAVADGMTALEIDPQWERAYQRVAEAYLALGPYDRAMDACRILKRAVDTIAEPSANFLALYDKAKKNAKIWCSYMTVSGKQTIPQIIHETVRNLKAAAVRSFAIDNASAEDIAKAGDAVAEAATAVNGALQMVYLHRSQWEKESKEEEIIMNDIQIDLRTIARALPLALVEHSKVLESMIFTQDPFNFWGMDKLDRLGVDTLKEGKDDPCESDEEDDPVFREKIARKCGGEMRMGLGEVRRTLEMFGGKQGTSFDQDMAPTNFTAFTFTLFQRLLQSKHSPLREEAFRRLEELYLLQNSNPAWAGGEFMGLCVNVAAGTGKYGTPSDPEQMKRMIKSLRGVSMIVKELVNSIGDRCERFMEGLQNISPDEWKTQDVRNVRYVISLYVLNVMDDKLLGAERADHAVCISTILSNLLDAFPEVLEYFKTGDLKDVGDRSEEYFLSSSVLMEHMSKSPFGNFVARKYFSQEMILRDRGEPYTTNIVMNSLVEIWDGLGNRKRAAYRWDVLDQKTQEEFQSRHNMAPISKVDKFKNQGSKVLEEISGDKLPKKLPECEFCGKREGFGVELFKCPCKLVAYCGKECQKKNWQAHKQVCKEARPVSSK